jgi:hypothetical protein
MAARLWLLWPESGGPAGGANKVHHVPAAVVAVHVLLLPLLLWPGSGSPCGPGVVLSKTRCLMAARLWLLWPESGAPGGLNTFSQHSVLLCALHRWHSAALCPVARALAASSCFETVMFVRTAHGVADTCINIRKRLSFSERGCSHMYLCRQASQLIVTRGRRGLCYPPCFQKEVEIAAFMSLHIRSGVLESAHDAVLRRGVHLCSCRW